MTSTSIYQKGQSAWVEENAVWGGISIASLPDIGEYIDFFILRVKP